MSKHARYRIVNWRWLEQILPADTILLFDDGDPWDEYLTVTNDAEWVLQQLKRDGKLEGSPAGKRVIYVDSDMELTELLHVNGEFSGFAHYDATQELSDVKGALTQNMALNRVLAEDVYKLKRELLSTTRAYKGCLEVLPTSPAEWDRVCTRVKDLEEWVKREEVARNRVV